MFVYILKCSTCFELLTYDKFSKKSNSKRGYSYKCKSCHNEYVRENWYKKNSDKQKQSSKKWKNSNKNKILASKYKTTESEIISLLEKSSNKCEVCNKTFKICIDHCHTTGKVRGVLCMRCNAALGLLQEDQYIVSNLLDYIRDKC
ncbi:TPA: hypothetical protein NNW70_004295 [Salmonella enterica]|nr:hypothetical protein [Salmonella enterica]HCH9608005.1 hypothetical protein [Salmonella enterica]HDI5000299.1 hypothetical protein [Salmonella enterica]